MARRGVPAAICATLVAFSVTAACAQAATPTVQTCRAVGLELTFVMPSDWGCREGPSGPDPAYEATAPSRVGQLEVYAATTGPGGSLSTYAPKLVSAVRRDFNGKGTHLTVASTNTRVGSVPALLVSVHYQGLWLQGSGQRGEIVHLIYFFHRKGVLYEFDYSSVTPWATKYVPVFGASAKSIRFSSR